MNIILQENTQDFINMDDVEFFDSASSDEEESGMQDEVAT